MKEQLKQIFKNVFKTMGKRILKPLTAGATVLVLISGCAYVVKLDDGTYKEGDESNTQYVASEFINSTTIDSDGNITPNTTVKELWDKLKEKHSRVTVYLREPEQLAKLINAEMVTQYLDTRDNPDEEIDWDKAIDINSNKIQGIIKLKRADSDGKTSTMTYVDPETFQSYIDDYNESGSKSDRDKAMKYFTLEAASSTGDTTSETTGQLETIDGVDMKVLTKSGKVTFYNGDGSAIEGGSNDRHGELLADGKVASRGLAPDRSIIYIRTQKSGEGSFANGKFFYVCDTGGGLASNQIDVYAKVTQSKLNRAPYGTYNGKASMFLVKSNATWKEYLNKYYNKTVEGSTSSSNNKNSNDSKKDTKNDNDKTLCWPTDGTTISSEFGLRNSTSKVVSRDHRGIDISVSEGTNVYACEDGKVITATNSKTAGNWVVIDHGNGYVSKYMHNSKLEVSAGDTVKKGQIIAKSGNTGNSTGPHVHFQIEYNKKAVDPMNFKYNNNQGDGTSGFGSDVENAKSTKQTYVAKVATWEETTDTLKSTDPSVTTYDNASHNMTTTDINYQDLVKGYTMPFDYLWDLLVMSEDRSFVLDLVDLVLSSKLEITVHDNLTTDTNENIYTYTKKKKTETEATVKAWAGTTPGQETQSKTKSGNWTDEESNSYKTTHTVVTKTNTLATSLTLADTWIVKYTKNYKFETPKADVTKTKNNIDDKPYGKNADSTNDGKDTYGHAAKLLEELKSEYNTPTIGLQYTDGIIVSEKEKIYNATVNQEENITDTVETKKYVEQPKKLEEKTDKNAKDPNFVTIFLKNKRAKRGILGAPSWLYAMLKKNEKTSEMVDLTKYLLYKATDNTDFWDKDKKFDFSIFDPDNFSSVQSKETDFVVETDDSNAVPTVSDKNKMKNGLKKWLKSSSKEKSNALSVLDTVMECQEKYKVNAVFVYSFLMNETSMGTASTNYVKNDNNWGSWNLGHKFNSPQENIETITRNMKDGDLYFTKGNNSVSKIGAIYCPNTKAHPKQCEEWIKNVEKNMNALYSAMGMQVSSGTSGSVATGGKGTIGVYTSTKGKKYNLYLQGSGAPWQNEDYGDSHNMGKAGCGPTAEAIIASAYDGKITPSTTRKDMVSMFGSGNHSSASCIAKSLKNLVPGIKTSVGSFNSAKIKSCLQNSGEVWLVVRSCKYTSGSHCIALIDYKDSGKVYVAHGNSKRRAYGWDDLSYIARYNKSEVLYVGGK